MIPPVKKYLRICLILWVRGEKNHLFLSAIRRLTVLSHVSESLSIQANFLTCLEGEFYNHSYGEPSSPWQTATTKEHWLKLFRRMYTNHKSI